MPSISPREALKGSSGSKPPKSWYQIRAMLENVKYVCSCYKATWLHKDHFGSLQPRQLCSHVHHQAVNQPERHQSYEMRPSHLMQMDVLMVGLLLEMRPLWSRFATISMQLLDDLLRKGSCWSKVHSGFGKTQEVAWNVPWSKVAILGMVIPPLIGILIMGI